MQLLSLLLTSFSERMRLIVATQPNPASACVLLMFLTIKSLASLSVFFPRADNYKGRGPGFRPTLSL